MAVDNTIKLRKSTTASAVPSSLADGELAINQRDGLLFWKDHNGVIQSKSLLVEIVSMGAIGSTPNANGASISGGVLTLQPADGTYGGVLTAIAQSIVGAKTFLNNISIISGLNTFKTHDGASSITPNITVGTSGGKSLALMAGSGGTTFTFDNSGVFAISGDTKTNIDGGSSNGGTVFVQVDGTGVVTLASYTGTGNRMLVVTSSGIVDTQAIPAGITRSINSISTTTTAGSAANTDYVYLCSSTFVLTLPTAIGNLNRYTVKRVGTGTITVATTSSQTIDGSATAALTVQYQSLEFISDNANWNIV